MNMKFKIRVIINGANGTSLSLGTFDGTSHGKALKQARDKYPELDNFAFTSKRS